MSDDSLRDLGLPDALLRAADDRGIETTTPLQAALIPVVRRGGNAVVIGAAGSGARTGILLALLARLIDEHTGTGVESGDAAGPERGGRSAVVRPRVLVLAATEDEAAEIAVRAGLWARHAGLAAGTLRRAGDHTAVIAATAARALGRVRESELKLDALTAVVIDGFGAMQALGQIEQLDALLGLTSDVQRVVRADTGSDGLDEYATRAVRRALRIPARPADRRERGRDRPLEGVAIAVVESGAGSHAEAIADSAWRAERPLRLFLREPGGAEALRVELAARGLATRTGEDGGIGVEAPGSTSDEVVPVSVDPPASAAELAHRHAGGGYVVVRPRELPHLRAIADEVGATLQPAPTERPTDPALAAFRERIRQALQQEDLGAQALVLEPLLRERPATEIAAALAALLRSERPDLMEASASGTRAAAGARQPARDAASAPGGRAPSSGAASGKPAPPPSPARLYVSLGERDGVRPGDIVGAITGEAGVSGGQVGRIDIRDAFSVVEVESGIAARVIDALNGRTVKGRSVRVDYDRGSASGRTRDAPRGAPRRGDSRGRTGSR